MFLSGESPSPSTPSNSNSINTNISEEPSRKNNSKNPAKHSVASEDRDDTTAFTEGSTSEDDTGGGGGGWFGGMGTDFRNLAISLKDAVPPTIGAIGDIANFVQRSALSVAAEIAELERESDEEGIVNDASLRLPWEVMVSSANDNNKKNNNNNATNDMDESYTEIYEEDEELRVKIKSLSKKHDSFLEPFKGNNLTESSFVALDEPRIRLIRRLLDLDENLAATHAHLSGNVFETCKERKVFQYFGILIHLFNQMHACFFLLIYIGRSDVKESVFWANYFFNCDKVRREHLECLQSQSMVSDLSALSNPDERENTFEKDEMVSQTSQNSLIPVDDTSDETQKGEFGIASTTGKKSFDDDSSYIQVNNKQGIASPPCSSKSIDDLVLISKHIHSEEKK